MRKFKNAILASLVMFAVVAAVPAYTDFINSPNPGHTDIQDAKTPAVMGSWE